MGKVGRKLNRKKIRPEAWVRITKQPAPLGVLFRPKRGDNWEEETAANNVRRMRK